MALKERQLADDSAKLAAATADLRVLGSAHPLWRDGVDGVGAGGVSLAEVRHGQAHLEMAEVCALVGEMALGDPLSVTAKALAALDADVKAHLPKVRTDRPLLSLPCAACCRVGTPSSRMCAARPGQGRPEAPAAIPQAAAPRGLRWRPCRRLRR